MTKAKTRGGRIPRAEIEKSKKKFAEKYKARFGERDQQRADEAELEKLDFDGVKAKERADTLRKSTMLQRDPKLREAYLRKLKKESAERKVKFDEDVAQKQAEEQAIWDSAEAPEDKIKLLQRYIKDAERNGELVEAEKMKGEVRELQREIEANKPTLTDEIFNGATKAMIKATSYIPVVGTVVSKVGQTVYDALPKKNYKNNSVVDKVVGVVAPKIADVVGKIGSGKLHIHAVHINKKVPFAEAVAVASKLTKSRKKKPYKETLTLHQFRHTPKTHFVKETIHKVKVAPNVSLVVGKLQGGFGFSSFDKKPEPKGMYDAYDNGGKPSAWFERLLKELWR